MMQILSCHHSDGRRDPGPNPRQQAWMWVGCCLTVVTRHLLESDDQQASLPAGQSSGSWGPTKDPHSVTKWESTLRVWKKNVPPPTHIFSLRSLWTVSSDPEKPTVMITSGFGLFKGSSSWASPWGPAAGVSPLLALSLFVHFSDESEVKQLIKRKSFHKIIRWHPEDLRFVTPSESSRSNHASTAALLSAYVERKYWDLLLPDNELFRLRWMLRCTEWEEREQCGKRGISHGLQAVPSSMEMESAAAPPTGHSV